MLTSKRVIYVAVAALAVAGVLLAQGPPFGHRGGARGERMGRIKEFVANYLDLTEAQKAQAKDIFTAARQSAQPVFEQLKQGREAMRTAVTTGKPDAELERLAAAQGALAGQLSAIHAKAFAKFWAILTPDQQAKAAKLPGEIRGRRATKLHDGF